MRNPNSFMTKRFRPPGNALAWCLGSAGSPASRQNARMRIAPRTTGRYAGVASVVTRQGAQCVSFQSKT